MKIINPANEETLAELKEDTRESVMKKFRSLKSGQRSWAEVPVKERIACIARFDELLEKDKDELAETLTSEMGKPIRESYNELNGARGRLKYFIDNDPDNHYDQSSGEYFDSFQKRQFIECNQDRKGNHSNNNST